MNQEQNKPLKLLNTAIFLALMYLVIQFAIAWGIEEKSWWEKSWEFVTGGTLGLVAGIAFFVVFGAIGWVSGPIYGAVGVIGLAFGGALGGLGLGALVNIIRDPNDYTFSWMIIIPTLLIGAVISRIVARSVSTRLAILGSKVRNMPTLNAPVEQDVDPNA